MSKSGLLAPEYEVGDTDIHFLWNGVHSTQDSQDFSRESPAELEFAIENYTHN